MEKIIIEDNKIGKVTWEVPEVVRLALLGTPLGTKRKELNPETVALLQQSVAAGVRKRIESIIGITIGQIVASCHCGPGIALQLEVVCIGGEFSLKVQEILLDQFKMENTMAEFEAEFEKKKAEKLRQQ